MEFNMDLVLEIMSRASLETVARCRLLSKECDRRSYGSYFKNLHSQRGKNKITSGFFIQSSVKNSYCTSFINSTRDKISSPDLPLNFLPGPVKILASATEGILLCVSTNPKHHKIPEYYICKPTTKQWQKIPNPKTRFFTRRVAMRVVSLNPLRYKIVRFSDPSKRRNLSSIFLGQYSLRVEIFDSDCWMWKQLEEIYFPVDAISSYEPTITACGNFHWLTTKKKVFTFNDEDETWSIFSPPEDFPGDGRMCLAKYEGRLCLVCEQEGSVNQTWVMEDYGRQVWDKKHVVDEGALILYNREYDNIDDVDKTINVFEVFILQSDDEEIDLAQASRQRYTPSRNTRNKSEKFDLKTNFR